MVGDGAAGVEQKNEVGDEADEERRPNIGRVPRAPTTQEWNDHMTHHSEYRDWCPFCVQGKGISYQHRRGPEDEEKIGITVSMDWAYLNSKDDESDEYGPPTLVAYDNNTKAIWTMARESNEVTEDLVSWMCQNLRTAGYSGLRITLKSDGEPSMKLLKNLMALKRESPTSVIHTPVRESKANGAMEAAIRSWKGQARTIRLYLEHRLKAKVEYGHPLLTWLTFWA